MSSKKPAKTGQSFGTGIAIGIGVSVILSVILAMIAAALIINERIGENIIEYTVPCIILIASVTGSVIAGKAAGEKVAVVTGITGALFLLIFMGIGILFFDGGFHNLWAGLLSIVLSWILSCAICIRGKRSSAKRKRAYR